MDHPGSVIIVGVGPFISMSLARRLAAAGWNVALLSRSQEKLNIFAAELEKTKKPGAKIVTRAVDAANPQELVQALEEIKQKLDAIDVLCYNAARVGKILDPGVITK